eukprot:11793506-Alexandrium_andersonii.AAC.1
MSVGQLRARERVRSGDVALLKWPGERNPADVLTKAVNADLIDRHLRFVNLRWEDGQASRAPLLDGFSWDMLRPD